jgi:hypothetical protein
VSFRRPILSTNLGQIFGLLRFSGARLFRHDSITNEKGQWLDTLFRTHPEGICLMVIDTARTTLRSHLMKNFDFIQVGCHLLSNQPRDRIGERNDSTLKVCDSQEVLPSQPRPRCSLRLCYCDEQNPRQNSLPCRLS